MKRIQIILAVSSLLFTFSVIHLIKKESLDLKYSLLWLLSGIALIFLALNPFVIPYISNLVGILDHLNMLFLVGNLFLIAIVFSLSVAMSRNSRKIKNLTQELALLKVELENSKKTTPE